MRECWINVYERRRDGFQKPGAGFSSRRSAELAGGSIGSTESFRLLYRLHVRLKLPALPATDALAAVKAGEDNGRAARG
ncbi:hypothetical protein A3862_27235 [Methylobacterium sp. XJLW]|nr:hypothetical protein A3862_27235 [Methylobacterium sp. XJLW]